MSLVIFTVVCCVEKINNLSFFLSFLSSTAFEQPHFFIVVMLKLAGKLSKKLLRRIVYRMSRIAISYVEDDISKSGKSPEYIARSTPS